jgi:hypothetical protein
MAFLYFLFYWPSSSAAYFFQGPRLVGSRPPPGPCVVLNSAPESALPLTIIKKAGCKTAVRTSAHNPNRPEGTDQAGRPWTVTAVSCTLERETDLDQSTRFRKSTGSHRLAAVTCTCRLERAVFSRVVGCTSPDFMLVSTLYSGLLY